MKLSPEARAHILETYATIGAGAARELATKYGIKPTYVRHMAKRNGVKAKRANRQKRWMDPRWQWAIERGAIVA